MKKALFLIIAACLLCACLGSATMLGGGGAGMTVTALILGLVLGAAAAALVLKGKKKA